MREAGELLGEMVEVVRAAGRICRRVQHELRSGDTFEKDDRSPVTVADLAVQALIGHRLFPGVPLVGEEDSGPLRADAALRASVLDRLHEEWPEATAETLYEAVDRGDAEGGKSGRFLVLDPIDGTKGFLRGDQYAVALAMIEDGTPVAGVLGCPNLPVSATDSGAGRGLVVAGAIGRGTHALPLDGNGTDGRQCAVSDVHEPVAARICESVEAGHTKHDRTARIREALGSHADPVRVDSQAKYALLALGRAEVYLRIPRDVNRSETIWDHAAGALVVAAAGGRVTDLDGLPLDFGLGRRLWGNRGIVATNGHVHEAVLAAAQTD